MASSGLRKKLALIKYQHPRCIGVDVSYEYLLDAILVTGVMDTINSINELWLYGRC